jgi:hypothetical protein
MTISIRVEQSKLDNLDNKAARVANSQVSKHREEIQAKSKLARKAARELDVALKMMS